jgi:hypothetical protein
MDPTPALLCPIRPSTMHKPEEFENVILTTLVSKRVQSKVFSLTTTTQQTLHDSKPPEERMAGNSHSQNLLETTDHLCTPPLCTPRNYDPCLEAPFYPRAHRFAKETSNNYGLQYLGQSGRNVMLESSPTRKSKFRPSSSQQQNSHNYELQHIIIRKRPRLRFPL